MAMIDNMPLPIEPAKTNRYIINLVGIDIPNYLFRKYKLHNEGDELIFTTEFYETVQYTFNPSDFFNITGVEVSYLDPTGAEHNSISFNVKGSNYIKKGDYSDDSITTNKLRFIVDKKTINIKYTYGRN